MHLFSVICNILSIFTGFLSAYFWLDAARVKFPKQITWDDLEPDGEVNKYFTKTGKLNSHAAIFAALTVIFQTMYNILN